MNNSNPEYKCVFCDETFPVKEELQDHFRKHGDPNFNQKKNRGKNQNETEDSVGKPKEQIEMVECDVCPEMFTSIAKAITHKHKAHPHHDTKYFCSWCGKLFTMKHLYNKHLNAAHSNIETEEVNRSFHCDTCDVDFVYSALTYHNKFFHKQDDLPIIGHSKKCKMVGQENVLIFYCPFCGEEFDNKVNLHKHMSDDHSDENQSPEEVLRCPLCEAIFYHLDAYELHLTYHSVEDLYTERNQLIDEITDFSLETVQPLREKIECAENVETQVENQEKAIGIEELLEFTMDDNPSSHRKSKKHKKHKKSKKAAITLDEFLNMNKDVFGEGIDFQGVEEVPTQVVAKRLKVNKTPAKVVSSDIAKLKRQGIVVKKQSTKVEKPIKKGMSNLASTLQNLNTGPQPKINKLSSGDILSKLLNQGSQIKIIKKSNPDNEENRQHEQDKVTKECLVEEKISDSNDLVSDACTKANKINSEVDQTNSDCENNAVNSVVQTSPSILSSEITNNLNESKTLQNSDEISNNSKTLNDGPNSSTTGSEFQNCSDKTCNLVDSLNALRNNSNIAIKKSLQNVSESNGDSLDRAQDDEPSKEQIEEPVNNQEERTIDKESEKSSLDAVKHLSHVLTIKHINQTTNSPLSNNKSENGSQGIGNSKIVQIVQNNSPKTADIKNLSNVKNLPDITIKSSSFSPKQPHTETTISHDDQEQNHETDDEWSEDLSEENNINKIAHVFKNPQLSIQSKHSSKTNTQEKVSPKITANKEDNTQSSDDPPKHVKNLPKNPVNVNNNKNNTPKSSPDITLKKGACSKSSVQKELNEEGIEVFNIDDSDSDDGSLEINNSTTKINKTNDSKLETNKSTDVLRNLNKNITIKSTKVEKQVNKHLKNEYDDDSDEEINETEPLINISNKFNSPKPNHHQAINNSILKNLGKNITIKSRNSSPSQPVRAQDNNDSRDSQLGTNDANSDSDIRSSPMNRVKITEIENTSDDEFTDEHRENVISQANVKVEHPDDSHSDHSAHDDSMDEEFNDMPDIESEISNVHKISDTSRSSLNSARNIISKDVTIKSSNKLPPNNKSESSLGSEDIPEFAKNLSNQISIKQIKKPQNKPVNQIEQPSIQSMNQSFNQKVASSSNQVNTLNKEVKTVKTFHSQTKTVIQEITTTVTKTIKTVNQTTNEVRNVGQSSSTSTSQKIHGLSSNINQKNFQGVKVQQSSPNVRPKIRGTAPQIMRPAICGPTATRPVCAPFRASIQLVPVRHSLPRSFGPRSRFPNTMNVRPSTSGQQRPQIGGKPVKISPGAVITSSKRPTEATGPFSCFKKPKESLIPVSDFPMVSKDDGESVQFSSAVHMSKSNFSSTTKTVKGNSVVTSTKTRSEMKASSQQLNRLQGMSGLSVVKTNQTKQDHVEEHSEMSESKRNTLEAIQKLQSQGLLVKKPRLDAHEDSDHSQPDSDDMGHNSSEEFDE